MVIFEFILTIIAWLLFITGCYITISCFIGLIRFKDFFVKVHTAKIGNIYGISIILFSGALISFDIIIFVQMFLIIILNIIMTITTVHALCRVALNNNIKHEGLSRRKYNEMLEEKKKEELEKKQELQTTE
ncbi:MAG TPA: monovalent cation/H(+) antiporter subunit G [Rickettsiales bacterium]|nr:monovalent cation/H(+) antiporter subunit G [Rickettsiales bacterium]